MTKIPRTLVRQDILDKVEALKAKCKWKTFRKWKQKDELPRKGGSQLVPTDHPEAQATEELTVLKEMNERNPTAKIFIIPIS